MAAFAAHAAACLQCILRVRTLPAGPPFLGEKSHTGYISAINRIGDNTGVGVMYFIGAGLWTLESLWSLWVYKLVYRSFRGHGMSAAQVKREAAGRAASSAV